MAAMAGRPQLASIVTDVLVLSGEAEVIRAVAANPGAVFSTRGEALLLARAALDTPLQTILSQRAVTARVPPETTAPAHARRPLERGRFVAAAATIAQLFTEGRLAEPQIRAFAGNGQLEEVICSLAALSDLPVPLVMRLFALNDQDLLLAIARRLDFTDDTAIALGALLAGTAPGETDRALIGQRYGALTTVTAERALRFTQIRAGASLA
jgi:hypothetical protein